MLGRLGKGPLQVDEEDLILEALVPREGLEGGLEVRVVQDPLKSGMGTLFSLTLGPTLWAQDGAGAGDGEGAEGGGAEGAGSLTL